MALEINISESGKYVTGNAFLRMRAWASRSGVLEFTGETLSLAGVREFHSTRFTLIGTRLAELKTYKIPEGVLINWQCRVASGNLRFGRCFVKGNVRNVVGDVTFDYSTLFSGYVSTTTEIAYPGDLLRGSLEGRQGNIRPMNGTTPAAGVDIAEVVPIRARWLLAAFRATLTTDSQVADRLVELRTGDVTIEGRFPAQAVQKKNEVRTYNWILGCPPYDSNENHHVLFLPTFPEIPAEVIISTFTENLQSGDQWTRPDLTAEEWVEV